jgi:hypothetical protein
VDGRQVVFVEPGFRDAEILSGDRRDLADDVPRARRLGAGTGRTRDDLQVAGQCAVVLLQEIVLRRRAGFDQLELEDRGLADDVLRARHVADAWHLDEDFLARLTGDARLGHAELVDAAIDRLQRLLDRLLAEGALDGRLHSELVGAGGEGIAVVARHRDFIRRLPELPVLVRRHPLDAERRRGDDVDGRGNPHPFEGIAQLLA